MVQTRERKRYGNRRRDERDTNPLKIGDTAVHGITREKVTLLAEDGVNAFTVESIRSPKKVFHASTTELTRSHEPVIQQDDNDEYDEYSPDNEY